jgi:hypothetical protein
MGVEVVSDMTTVVSQAVAERDTLALALSTIGERQMFYSA